MGKKVMLIRMGLSSIRMLPHILLYLSNKTTFDKDLVKYAPDRGG